MSEPIQFQSAHFCFVGNHVIEEGEPLSVLEDSNGFYILYCADDDEPLTYHLNAHDINKLAGKRVVGVQS